MSKLDVRVEEYTTPNPITADERTPVEKLRDLMKEHGIRHIPIVRANNVVGIVSERDLKVVSGLNLSERGILTAADIMAADPVTVSVDDSLEDVVFQMSEKKIGSVIVNSADDEFLGIFTVTDALNALVEIVR